MYVNMTFKNEELDREMNELRNLLDDVQCKVMRIRGLINLECVEPEDTKTAVSGN